MTQGLTIALFNASAPRRVYPYAAAGIALITLTLSWMPALSEPLLRLVLFYSAMSLAYITMPLVRRGDIPLMASWVILISELTPCIFGQMLSPERVAADTFGVFMATAPIYIARIRQVHQGDIRAARRRTQDESGAPVTAVKIQRADI